MIPERMSNTSGTGALALSSVLSQGEHPIGLFVSLMFHNIRYVLTHIDGTKSTVQGILQQSIIIKPVYKVHSIYGTKENLSTNHFFFLWLDIPILGLDRHP
jgi:hypothetical protein